MTYAQLRALQKRSQYANLDPRLFALAMGQQAGDPAVTRSLADPSWGSRLEAGINDILDETGVPQAFGGVGQTLFGDTGRDVFEKIPRSMLNLAPLALGGPVGMVGAGALGALQAWGETEQMLPTAVGGALSAFAPQIGALGGRAGVGAVRGLTDDAMTPLLARIAGSAGPQTREMVTRVLGNALPRNVGEMAGRVAGEQAAFLGTDVAGTAAEIAFDDNRSFDELASPEYWAAQAISNLPFLGFDVVQGRRDLRAGRNALGDLSAAIREEHLANPDQFPQLGPSVGFPKALEGQSTPLGPEWTIGNQALVGIESGQFTPGPLYPQALSPDPIAMPGQAPGGIAGQPMLMQGSALFRETNEVAQQKMRLDALLASEAARVPAAIEQTAEASRIASAGRTHNIELPDFTEPFVYEGKIYQKTLREELASGDYEKVVKAVRYILPVRETKWLNDILVDKLKHGEDPMLARKNTLEIAKSWAWTMVQEKKRKTPKLGDKVNPIDDSRSLTPEAAWNTKVLNEWITERLQKGETDEKVKAELDWIKSQQEEMAKNYTSTGISMRPQNELWSHYYKWATRPSLRKKVSLQRYVTASLYTSKNASTTPTQVRPSPTNDMTFSREAMEENHRDMLDMVQVTSHVMDDPTRARVKLEERVRKYGRKVQETIWPAEMLDKPEYIRAMNTVLQGLRAGNDSGQLMERLTREFTNDELNALTSDPVFMGGLHKAFTAKTTDRNTLIQALDGAVDMETRAQIEGILQIKDMLDAEGRKDQVTDVFRGMLEAAGADPMDIARELPVLTRLYNFHESFKSVDFMGLQTQQGRNMSGLYTSTPAGRRLVAMSASKPQLLQWVMAHELTGHGLWDALDKGLLPPLHARKLERFRASVQQMTALERRKMLIDVADALPKQLRNDPEVRALLDTDLAHADASEVLANLNAIAALNLTTGTRAKLRDQVAYLPKWFGDMYDVMAHYMHRIVNTLRGFVSGPERKMFDQHVANLRSIMQESRANEQAASQLQRLAQATEPGGLRQLMGTPDDVVKFWTDSGNPELSDVVLQHLGGEDLKRAAHLTGAGVKRAGNWLAYTLQPVIQYGSFDKNFRPFAQQQQIANQNVQKDITDLMGILGATYDGTITTWGAKGVEKRLSDDAMAATALNDAIISVQKPRTVADKEVRMSVEEAYKAGDAEVVKLLQPLTDQQRNLVFEAAANRRLFHRSTMEKVKKLNYEFAAAQTATTSLHTIIGDPVGLNYMPVYSALKGMLPEYAALPRTGDPKQDIAVIVPFQEKVAVALQQAGHSPETASMASINFVGMLESADKAFKRQLAFDSYVNESRQGQFKVTFTVPGASEYAKRHGYKDADHGYVSANTREDAEFLAKIYQDKGMTGVKVLDPTNWRAQYHEKLTSDVEDIITKETSDLRERLLHLGMPEDKVKDALENFDLMWKITRDRVAHDLGTLTLTRRFAPGRESLNMGEQQAHHLQSMMRGAQRRINEAMFIGMTRDVDYHKSPEGDALLTSWRNNMAPDKALTRAMGRFGYFYALGLNMPNYAQEWVQGLTGFPTKLIDEGASFSDAYRLVARAQKDVAKMQLNKEFLKGGTFHLNHLPAEEREMIEEAIKSGLMGNGMLSEVTEDTLDQQFRKQKVAAGWAPDTATSRVGEYAEKTFNAVTRLHSKFTAGSTSVALLASYRFLRDKGMSHVDAKKQARVLFNEGMMIGGRYNRAAGLWDSGSWTPVSAMMSALQSFTSNTIASTINLARRAADGKLPRGERIASTKALTNMVLVQTALAGVMGLPLVGPLMALAEKTVGFDLQAEMAELAAKTDDPLAMSIVNQVALRGISRAFGGPDVGARYGLGNVMGLNENDGFSFENLFGPVGSAVGRSVMGLGMLLKGEPLKAAAEAAPVALRKTLKLWSDDWQFRSKDGNLLLEDPTQSEKLMYMLGMSPTRMSAKRENYNMIQRAREREHKAEVEFTRKVADELSNDPASAQALIAQRAQETDVPYEDLVERVVNMMEARQFEAQPTRGGTKKTAELDAAIATGYTGPAPIDETEREEYKAMLSIMLGANPNEKRQHEAAVIDEMRRKNPFLTVRQARILLERAQRKNLGSTAGVNLLLGR